MTRNIGSIDRMLRIIAGLALLAFAAFGWPATSFNWVGWIGVVPLVTAFLGNCPAYALIGVNTCPLSERKG